MIFFFFEQRQLLQIETQIKVITQANQKQDRSWELFIIKMSSLTNFIVNLISDIKIFAGLQATLGN